MSLIESRRRSARRPAGDRPDHERARQLAAGTCRRRVVTPRPWLRTLARVAVAAIILAYLLSRIPASEVYVALGSAAPGLLAMAVLAALTGQLAVADRLRRLVEGLGLRATTAELLQIDLAARFYGLVLPAGNVTGVLARFYQIARRDGAYGATAVALALERLVATLTLCGVGVLFWLIERPTGTWPALLLMLGGLLGLLALQALLLLDLPLPARLAAGRPPKLASLYAALGRARRLPRALLTRVLLLGVVVHLIGIVAFAMVAAALGLELSYLTIGWTRSAAILVAILPVSLAGLGLREGAFVLLLAPYGIAPADALAYSLLAFTTTVLAIGLIGGVVEAFRLLR